MDTELLSDDSNSLPYIFSPVTFLSCLVILVCAFVVSPAFVPYMTSKYKQVGEDRKFLDSLPGACLHHLLVSVLSVYALASGTVSNRACCKSALGFTLLQTTLGYFTGDLIVMLCDPKLRRNAQVIAHHCVGITGLALVLNAQGKVMFVAITFQVIEMSSLFLDITLAMDVLGCRKDSLMYKGVGGLMTVTFFMTRVATVPWHWYEYVTFIATSPIVPLHLKLYTAFNYLFFDSLSLYWFSKIMKGVREVLSNSWSKVKTQ